MAVVIVSHPAFADHETGEHPERAARWQRTHAALTELPVAMVTPSPITPEALQRVHPLSHAARIEAFCRAGGGRLDDDTVACEASYEVALLSAGAAIAAVDEVISGRFQASVALCRPPGHHALADATMGFCFFNNAAVAVRHAQAVYGIKRVAVIDWDLHHGNGTEAIFYEDPSVLYLSTHQHPNWPGTGNAGDVGIGAGLGFNVNVPLPMGTGDIGYLRAFREVFAPILKEFEPELIIVSAGFDAHWRDPLGRMGLTVGGFAALTREVQAWAKLYAQGRLVVLMEGGYDLEALAASMQATVVTLLAHSVIDVLGQSPYHEPIDAVTMAITEARKALRPHWESLVTTL
jgi:acetoin utilization deacetylase AcuC-like enzyme